MIVAASGDFFGTIGGGHLEEQVLGEASQCLKLGTPKIAHYSLCAKTGQCCGGSVSVFIDIINQAPDLYVFGAGHVGQASV